MRQKLILSLALLLLVSCTLTQKLWHPKYEEKIEKFLVSQDGRYVVFLGNEYHYVLSDDRNIVKNLLFSPHRFLMFIDSENTSIKLSQSNDVEASIVVKISILSPEPELAHDLIVLGFNYESATELALRMKLYGTRYLARQNLSYGAGSLNHPYLIKVYKDVSADKKIGKVMLTPITLTIDATLLIGKVLLFPFQGN